MDYDEVERLKGEIICQLTFEEIQELMLLLSSELEQAGHHDVVCRLNRKQMRKSRGLKK